MYPSPHKYLALVANVGWSADKEKSDKDKSDIEKRIDNSTKVIDEIMATPERLMRGRARW